MNIDIIIFKHKYILKISLQIFLKSYFTVQLFELLWNIILNNKINVTFK